MTKGSLAVAAGMGILTIIQVSLAPHFDLFGTKREWLNLVAVTVLAITLLERKDGRLGWASAFWGGAFLDLYSTQRFFGFWILVLIAAVAFIKLVIKRYVRIW